MSFKKKYKKLLRDPKLFFSDMLIKHNKKISFFKVKRKYESDNKFTVISAVYGVEKYLDDYFKSLVKQRLDFKKHIHLILVDDGSRDDSSVIIKKWQKKYPNNITYIHKKNGGQASARNLGIKYVKTEWLTFIDPDDFIDRDCFYYLSKSIDQNQPALLAMNLIFYIENLNIYKDTHPLRYKFKNLDTVSCIDLQRCIQLSSSSAVFRTDLIREANIFFDERIKPSFEDAKFIADYLLVANNRQMTFVPNAKYFYRKREDGTSTLDTSWQKKERYNQIFEYGYLAVFSEYKSKLGYIPKHIQRTVLYDMVWYCKALLNNKTALDILTDEEKEHFFTLISKVFDQIDTNVIWDFELAGIWFFYKVAILETFKDHADYRNIVYIEKFDKASQQILFSFFSHKNADIQIYSSGDLIEPVAYKQVQHYLGSKEFVTEYRCWVPISVDKKLSIIINNSKSRVHIQGKNYYPSVKTDIIFQKYDHFENIDKDIWLFIDKDTQANDNAEHLYRYIQSQKINKTCIFALSKSSHDWDRLLSEGFNMVDFDSKEFKKLLEKSSVILSSHADQYLMEYFGPHTLEGKKYVFLQHGVIANDLSRWLNNRLNINLFVTSTSEEYESIVSSQSPYKLTTKEVKLTGLARHDSLYKKKKGIQIKKQIIVMPTWRKSLVGLTGKNDSHREKIDGFMETLYAKSWVSLLNNEELLRYLDNKNYQLIFAPHPNIVQYLEYFNLPKAVKIWTAMDGDIQQLFLESEFMITDYSSVAFDMAFLKKMVLYYQFDSQEMFSGQHTSQKGYYSYENDGFGPVAYTENKLIEFIKESINYKNYNEYLPRFDSLYPYRDGENCARIYKEVLNLLEGNSEIDIASLEYLADVSISSGNYDSAIQRLNLIALSGIPEQQSRAYKKLFNLYYDIGHFSELSNALSKMKDSSIYDFMNLKLYMLCQNWEKAKSHLLKISEIDRFTVFLALELSILTGDKECFDLGIRFASQLNDDSTKIHIIVPIYQCLEAGNFLKAIELIDQVLTLNDVEIRDYKLELLAARICRLVDMPLRSAIYLDLFEKHTNNDHECRVEIAHLAFVQKDYNKVIYQLNSAYREQYEYMSEPVLFMYLKAIYALEEFDLYENVIKRLDKSPLAINLDNIIKDS